MSKKFILSCMAMGILASGFYNNVFATNGTQQTAENQRHCLLTKYDAEELIAEINAQGSTELVIPTVYTSIDESAFYGCSGLTSVTIPNSVKSIGHGAFADCSGFTSITIPNSVEWIGHKAFDCCFSCRFIVPNNNVKKLLINSGVSKYRIYNTEEKKQQWWIPIDGKIVIPGNVKQIEDSAFEVREDVTSVEILDSVKSIGKDAFYGCKELTSITIPDSVKSIDKNAFYGCKGLTSITIPKNVKSIGDSAFDGCEGLTSVTIPNSVKSIGYHAFKDCYACTFIVPKNKKGLLIKSGVNKYRIAIQGVNDQWWIPENGKIVIPGNVGQIEREMFKNRHDIKSVEILDGVKLIGADAFYGCSGLTSITIPDSVKLIGADAFYGCSGLTSITIPNSVQVIRKNAFNYCNACTFIVPNDRVKRLLVESGVSSKYRIAIGTEEKPWWIPVNGKIVIPGDIEQIDDGMFKDRHDITSVEISNGITAIGKDAFAWCNGLTSITIPNSVQSIGKNAFYGCDGLTSITIPDSVQSIGNGAFHCSGLKDIYVNDERVKQLVVNNKYLDAWKWDHSYIDPRIVHMIKK